MKPRQPAFLSKVLIPEDEKFCLRRISEIFCIYGGRKNEKDTFYVGIRNRRTSRQGVR